MEKVKQRITLNVSRPTLPPTVYAKQRDDNTRQVEVILVDEAERYTPSGTARIQMTKPDGTTVLNDCAITDGVITIYLTEQMLAVPGKAKAEVGIYDAGEYLSTQVFYIVISEEAYDPNAPQSSDEYNALIVALESTAGAAESAAAAALSAEGAVTARTAAETAQEGAEAAQANAEAAASQAASSVAGGQYMSLEIGDDGCLYFTKTDDLNDITFEITQNGELEVTVA